MKPIFLTSLIITAFAYQGKSQVTCFNIIVSPSVTQPTGAGIVSSTCSTLVVKWQGSTNQTYCVFATYFNTATNKTDTVIGTPTCDMAQSCTATLPVIAGAQVTWSVQAISNGSASYPVINVLEAVIPPCAGAGSSVFLNGKVLLQGPYDATANEMKTSLNASGILNSFALNQPYNTVPFNYAGLESVGAGFFAAHPGIVDWILIELRDPNSSQSIVARRAAFVRKDGSLVETDGTTLQVAFPGIGAANYFIVIRHRNHLGVRSALPVDFSCGTTSYDFSKSLYKAYNGGGTPPNEQLAALASSPTVYGIYGGDANTDAVVKKTGSAPSNNDYLALLAAISSAPSPGPTNVYRSEDLNMDGHVRKTGSSAATNDYLKLLTILGARNVIQQPSF